MKRPPFSSWTALFVFAAFPFLASGCGTLLKEAAIGAAEDPYRKQMESGKITQADYRREKEAIRRAADSPK